MKAAVILVRLAPSEPDGKLTDCKQLQPAKALLIVVTEPRAGMVIDCITQQFANAYEISVQLANAPAGKLIDPNRLQLLNAPEIVVTLASDPLGKETEASALQVLHILSIVVTVPNAGNDKVCNAWQA